jgi:acetyl-CoA carboxylase carboxyl transferase subunit alpha
MSNDKRVTPYERVKLARDKDRPGIEDYIEALFDGFMEFHGDRLFRDDPSIVAGIGYFHKIPVTVIGHRKGKTLEEHMAYNFGMASPEGYRKSLRLMKQAEKFNRPIITIIDTPGAYPGMEAEANGQAAAIAENLAEMSSLKVPVIAVVTGEGNSGGALAIGVANKVLMLENSIYCILSPEGFASILWKDSNRAPEACEVMRITAHELQELGLVDEVIQEGSRMFKNMDNAIYKELKKLMKMSPDKLAKDRYNKFRAMGEVTTMASE